ncbi:MAG: nucleotide exchange factor GrpE [Deltaproteobacteria bacterium]|nr:nucleotide exchange factor GrpE [Deltaproteobacteria bacterium]
MSDEDATRPKSAETSNGSGADDDPAESGEGTREATLEEQERLQLRAELCEVKDRWLRTQADLENFKRRAAREKQDALRFGSEHLLRDLLPVIDNLHRALAHAGSDDPIVAGVQMVLRGFDEVFERHGVKVVSARGATFDPNLHEAISHVESEHPPNTVIDEHLRGYVLHDRLLRPALVTVGKGPARAADGGGPERGENVAKDAKDA